MIPWFESLSTLASGVLIVGGFTVLTVLIGWLIARITPHRVRVEHNELAGFILAVIGVVYAVLLGFVAIGVWERFQAAEAHAYDEAGNVTIVYRDAGSFAGGHLLRRELNGYVRVIVSQEWEAMRRGQQSERAERAIERIDATVRALPVTSERLQNIQAQMLGAIDQALMDRDDRISFGATGINSLMWLVLVVGAVVTVGFTYFFGFRHTIMQHLMIGSLGLLIGLVLFLAVALDYPYRGSISIAPEAFLTALRTFHVIGP